MAKMEVSFYINKSPTIKVNKDLGEAVKIINIDIPDSVDVVNPVLIIDDSNNELILSSEVNYMVCGEPLSRSYFITAMDYTIAKRVIVAGHSDVLSNFTPAGNLNFISGDKDLNMVEDESYPLTDLFVAPIIHYPFNNWNGNFTNNGVGKRYIVRTVTSKARQAYVREVSIGDSLLYLGLYKYDIAGTAEDAVLQYAGETHNSYQVVKQNDIVKIGTYQYIFKAPEYNTGRLDLLN